MSSIGLEIAYLKSLAARQVFVDNEGKDAVPEERLFCFGGHVVRACQNVAGMWCQLISEVLCVESSVLPLAALDSRLLIKKSRSEEHAKLARQGLDQIEPPYHV